MNDEQIEKEIKELFDKSAIGETNAKRLTDVLINIREEILNHIKDNYVDF